MIKNAAHLIEQLENDADALSQAARYEIIMHCAGVSEAEAIGLANSIGDPVRCAKSAYALAAIAGFNPEVIRDTSIGKLEDLDADHDEKRVAAEMTALVLQARFAFRQ